ncbi:MAG: AMP-binding protein, partial [Eubacterium sp.]|nr:AMP-binding protein [Eubacterium sp.]
FYVLVNPQLPQSRIEQILTVLNSKVIITDEANSELAGIVANGSEILYVDQLLKSDISQKMLDNIREQALDLDPLYANFTSGSTGVPKGVLVSHKSVIDFIDIFDETFSITEQDIIANQAPFDFDVSVKDIYSAIRTGATLVLVPKELFSAPTQLLDYLCDNNITTMIWAVSALCLITTFHALDYKVPETVNKILFSGEVMPMKHLKEWQKHLNDAMFVNLYGPTEVTCNCTYHIIDNDFEYESGIPIGKAFKNREVFLLDDNNKLVTEENTTGEVCVKANSLALGYYNNPEQTQKHFVQNPLNDKYIDIIYRTGDLAKYDSDKNFVFQGRKDFQIKHMGHRIEIEEIEKAMEECAEVERACCVFDERKSKLYGFYIGNIDKKELHKQMKETLPVFMVPGALRQVEEMPLTKNGKIDRKLLLETAGGRRR